MTDVELARLRLAIKKSILHYLCDDWNNHKRGKAHKENQAIFDKEDGKTIWCNMDLEMVMEKVVKGIWSVNIEDILNGKRGASMTESEAIKQFKERIDIPDYKEQIPEYYEAMEIAINAIEKQIAKKPILKHDISVMHINRGNQPHEWKRIESDNWHCPECDSFVGERVYVHSKVHDQRKKKYCDNCGQKLDWSDK